MKSRDNQRSKVYNWEDKHALKYSDPLTLDGCRQLVKKVSGDLGLLPIEVPEKHRYTDPTADKNHIWLPTWAQTKIIVLHELAHCIMSQNFDWNSFAGHGPGFVRVYMWLLQKYAGQDLKHLQRTADQCKVKYAPDEFINYVCKTAAIQYIYFGLKDLSVKQLGRVMGIIAKEGLV